MRDAGAQSSSHRFNSLKKKKNMPRHHPKKSQTTAKARNREQPHKKTESKVEKASALLILTKRLTKESNSLHNGINAIERWFYMFPDAINIEDIPLTLDVTESPNVIGVIGDDSFKYTLEMLLRDRIINNFKCEIYDRSDAPLLDKTCGEIREDTLLIILTTTTSVSPQGYTKVRKFSTFFAGKADLFANVTKRVSVVYLYVPQGVVDLKIYHHIQSAIPIMLPWYFENESKLSDYELCFLKTLTSKNGASEYKRLLTENLLSKESQIEGIKKMFGGFYGKEIAQKKEELRLDLERLNVNFLSAQKVLEDYLKKISEAEAIYNQLQLAQIREATDIEDYMIKNIDCIRAKKVGCDYEISIDSYYDNYDEDMLRAALGCEGSALNEALRGCPGMRIVIEEIFLNHAAKIKARSYFKFSTHELKVLDDIYRGDGDRIINPHHKFYRCLGGFTPQINDAIRSGDYITALELARAATGNINFMDGAVISKFVLDLVNRAKITKCVEMPDGSSITIKDFYDIVKEGEKDE